MNSRFVKDFRKPWHSAFGIHFIEQAQILEDRKGVVENMSLLIKYMENSTEEENAITDNVNCENSEVVEDIEDEP
ncbi:hypothetical protein PR048_029012 [Dryococelus australis]|uniref:Uncharacterized protein n=1 Tax=Dryococelus australis TaxID=614101 RepID=A0ABQ9GFT1_9NEOP|nr:hypothetical protein PR048_029012 [Dryococelus australis]